MDFDEHPHNFTTAFTRIITGLHIAKLPEIQNSFSEWNTSVQEIILTYTKKLRDLTSKTGQITA